MLLKMRQFFQSNVRRGAICLPPFGKGRNALLKNRKTVVRLILFIVAVVVAVGAFTFGVLGIGHRESGYYDVGFTDAAASEMLGNGMHLVYYAQGNSSQIRQMLAEAQKAFSEFALRAWRLTKPDGEGQGLINLYWLNTHPGETAVLDADLYVMLSDALERTSRGEGYSVFAGPLHREWQNLRYLDEPQPFDPSQNEEEASRLAHLTALVNDPENFHLELNDEARTACLTVAPAVAETLSDLELDTPILDLNLLRDAYMLRVVARDLVAAGWTEGYLYADSGVSVELKTEGATTYSIWYAAKDAAAEAGDVTLASPSAYCQRTAFAPMGERYGFYAVQDGEETLLRHPVIDARTGMPADQMMTVSLGGERDEIVEMAYRSALLFFRQDVDSLRECTADWPDTLFLAFTFRDEAGALYTLPSMADRVTMNEDANVTLKTW